MKAKILGLIMIIILCSIIIISALLLKMNFNENNNTNTIDGIEYAEIQVKEVKSRNDFFTVANCVDKYITYLSTKEKDILYNFLDEEYRKKKHITRRQYIE